MEASGEFVEEVAEISTCCEEDDDDDEEVDEPKLKYERLSNDIGRILVKDAASAIAIHPKVMITDARDYQYTLF